MAHFKSLFILAVLLSLVGMAARSDAVVTAVFQDNFEYVPAVTFPNSAVDADPVATVGTWSSLTEQDSMGQINYGIQVANNASPGPAPTQGGSHYMAVQRVSGGYAFAVGSFTQVVTTNFTVDFDVYLPYNSATSSGLGVYMQQANSFSNWNDTPVEMDMQTTRSGGAWVYTHDTKMFAGPVVPYSQWTHIKIGVDFSTQSYSLTIGNNATETGFGFASPASGVTGIGDIMFYADGYTTIFYLDNIVVTADLNVPPPPATVIFQDDFDGNNVTPVSFPDPTKLATPSAEVGTWSSLFQQNSAGNIDQGIQVTNNAVPGPVGGSNYLAIQRVSYAWAAGTFAYDAGPDNSTIEFDLYMTYNAYGYNGLAFTVEPGTTYHPNGGYEVIYDYFLSNGGVFHYYDASYDHNQPNIALPLNQWVHVKYNINFVAQTYDLSINGSTVTGLAFMRTPTNSLGTMGFYAGGNIFYLDNVVVKRTQGICTKIIRGDYNQDCKVDFKDLSVFMGDWLKCNLQPATLCAN
jgi:hypothetical protein